MKKIFWFLSVVLCFGLVSVSAQNPPIPKEISGGVVNGKAISMPKPVYPAAAQAVKASGSVNVEIIIDEQGNVESATAISGHPLLRTAAVNAAREAKFAPTSLSGQLVKVKGIIFYNFSADKAPVEGNAGTNAVIDDNSSKMTIRRSSSGGVINGNAISLPKPEYPAAARAVNAGGTVVIEVIIDVEGNVTSAQATSGHPLLRQSAEEAARNAKFRATLVDGVPVIVKGNIVYNFAPSVKTDPADVLNNENSANSPKTISGGVVNGKAISLPMPVYPAAGRAVGASGAVNVSVKIDEQGNVESATVVSGHPLLRASAVEAAQKAQFAPTLLQGNPVKVTGILVYNFVP